MNKKEKKNYQKFCKRKKIKYMIKKNCYYIWIEILKNMKIKYQEQNKSLMI